MQGNQLKAKAVNGVFWTFTQRFMSIFIQFISNIILARLLTPDDYGCIGMLTIFMLLSATIIDGGFSSALIQKKRPTQEDYSMIFFWNVGLSIVIYLILFYTAPFIARFYHTELLCQVLRVQGVVLIINALQTIQVNQLNKQFRFKKISIVTLFSSFVSLSVTIVMAYSGYGVWSLVAQNLLMAFIPTLIYWCTNKWMPMLTFSVNSFKELFNFGFFMFLTSLTSTFANNIQGLLIGHFYNASQMGYYSKAHRTEMLASTSISQVVSQVSYPLYAELQDNQQKLIDTIKKLTLSVSYLTFPMMLLLILLAKPVFIILYSEKWLSAVPFFQILCIAGLAICLQSVNSQSIAAIGKSKAMFIWSFIKQTIGIIFMVVGWYIYGINGLLIGMVMKSWIIYIINASLVSKYIGYKLWKQLMDILPVLMISILAFTISYISSYFIGATIYVDAFIKTIIFAISYIVCSVCFKMESFLIFKDLATPYWLKIKRKLIKV